jgi:Ca-activated chloride channel family protein
MRIAVPLALAAVSVTAAQVGRPASSAESRAIVVYAGVEAPNGIPLEGLTRADFEIVSDGVSASLTSVSPGPLALHTLLVADLTASVTGRLRGVWVMPWPEAFSLAADRLITDVRTADRARMMGMIGSRFVPSAAWSNDRLTLQRALRVFVIPDGIVEPTPLWDAVDEALTLFPPEAERRAIVLVTDGRASGNRASLAEVSQRAMLAGVAVSIVELDPRSGSLGIPHSERLPGPAALLQRLAARSGGVYRFVTPDLRGNHNTRMAVGQILDLMRTSYVLTFVPPADGPAVRAIEVRVNRPGLTVRARQGYEVPAR